MALIKGLLVLGVVTVVSKVLDLHVINWMLQQGMTVILVALPVVFQPELRRALGINGRGRFFRSGQVISMEELERLIDEIVAISESLSKTHTGALIVFEREVGLNDYIDTGIAIDGFRGVAGTVGEYLHSQYAPSRWRRHHPGKPDHGCRLSAVNVGPVAVDGIRDASSGGYRHRELADAVVVVVSEETGSISYTYGGHIYRHLDGSNAQCPEDVLEQDASGPGQYF